MKHKSIRRGHSIKNKRKRSSGKRSGHKRSSSKRSGHKRSSSKRITKKRSSKRRLYGGGDVPPFKASDVTQKNVLHQNQRDGTQQAAQNSSLRGGGIISDIFGAPTGKDCNFDYVAKDAAGYCDVGNVATKNISTLLQVKENARYDVPKAV